MTFQKYIKLKAICTLILASHLSACASNGSVDFSVVHQSNQCGYTKASITYLATDQQQANAIKSLTPFSDESDRQALSDEFKKHNLDENLFLITQGTKPTPGYGFELTEKVASLDKDTLILPIRFSQPEKGKMLAQMLTSPCMIVGIDAKARYQHIKVDTLNLPFQP